MVSSLTLELFEVEVLSLSGYGHMFWLRRKETILALKVLIRDLIGTCVERLALFSGPTELRNEVVIDEAFSVKVAASVNCLIRGPKASQPRWQSYYGENVGCLFFRNEETGQLTRTLDWSAAPELTQAFWAAAMLGDSCFVELLSESMHPGCLDAAFWCAAWNGHFSVLDILAGRLSMAPSTYFSKALFGVSAGGHHRLVRGLLVQRADPQWTEDKFRGTALHAAAWFGYPHVLEEVLAWCGGGKRSGEVRPIGPSTTAATGNATIVNKLNNAVEKALQAALRINLLEARNIGGYTPLLCAAHCGHAEVVETLLNWGSNVEAVTYSNCSALHLASFQGHLEAIDQLLAYRGSDSLQGRSGASDLFSVCMIDHMSRIEKWIEVKDRYGATALISATMRGHMKVVERLLDLGADIRAKTNEGHTAEACAAFRGHTEVAAALRLERQSSCSCCGACFCHDAPPLASMPEQARRKPLRS